MSNSFGGITFAQAAANLSGSFAQASQRIAARYQKFTIRALAMGLTLDQAKIILEREDDPEACLERYARYGYLPVFLGEVLTREELAGQAFSYETVLNGEMDHRYANAFAAMGRVRQRGLVNAAIMLATELGGAEQGWPLERAMAAVMPYVEEA